MTRSVSPKPSSSLYYDVSSPQNLATVSSLLNAANLKDSRWLTLEVCRQFQRNACTRDENECKFAHPPQHVDIQYGRVTCCYDSIKGKCQRKDPACKYLHPPQHLKEQLVQNGRKNLIVKSIQLHLMQQQLMGGGNPSPQQPFSLLEMPNIGSDQQQQPFIPNLNDMAGSAPQVPILGMGPLSWSQLSTMECLSQQPSPAKRQATAAGNNSNIPTAAAAAEPMKKEELLIPGHVQWMQPPKLPDLTTTFSPQMNLDLNILTAFNMLPSDPVYRMPYPFDWTGPSFR